MDRERPGRPEWIGSAVIHLLALLVIVVTEVAQPAPPPFVAYEINLVSPPSPIEGEPAAPRRLEVETPEPEPEPPAEEAEETPPPPEETAEEESEPEEEAPPEEPEPRPEARPAEEEPPEEEGEPGVADPDPNATTSGENINVRIEGLRRDYPAYYNNIIRQINRCFRWRGPGNLSATVRFRIHRDGTVSDLSVVEGSGNLQFDFEAMGAVECAGSGSRFGALPEDLPYDALPIEFTFRPAGR